MARPKVLAAAVLLFTMLGALPVLAATQDQLRGEFEEAERRAAELQQKIADATEAYERTLEQIALTEDELDNLRRQASQLEQDAADADRLLSERARTVFMQGSTVSFEMLLSSGDAQSAMERVGIISALQMRETVRLEDAVAARTALDQTVQILIDREERLRALTTDLESQGRELEAALSSAQVRASSLRTILDRQIQIDRGVQQGIYACIFDSAFHFRDSWGAPRSGGRRHQGSDVMAPYNQPVYAFTSGVISRNSSGGLGGIAIYLRGDDGNVYYYAHLASIEPDGRTGQRVAAGQLIGRNGATGNAAGGSPHVHFQVAPGGGAPINPYPWLAAACY